MMARTTSMPASAAMRRNEGRARSESSGDEEEAAVESGSQRNGLPDTVNFNYQSCLTID